MKPTLWIIAGLAVLVVVTFGLLWFTVPHDHPDEARAQRDFLAEHPSFTIKHITIVEREVVAVCFRIFYYTPGDPALHEEFRQYLHTDGAWRITHRTTQR
jgi:hypothetical protein